MRARSNRISAPLLATVLGILIAGCSGGRMVIPGYNEADFNGKRVALVIPGANDLVMNNSAAYAASRGVATDGAREMLNDELRTGLPTALGAVLDSNTVVNYRDQVVAGTMPLDAVDDFPQGAPADWGKVQDAAREGNFDFFVVVNHFAITNTPSTSGRGDEAVNASFSLLDPNKRRVLTTNTVEISVGDPRVPSDTYAELAAELAKKLPFSVKKQ
jgi:hypothetical protein